MRSILPRPLRTSAIVLVLAAAGIVHGGDNFIPDPSFEETKPKDRWGHVFAKWSGWIYEGECEFRVSDIAHGGKHALLMVGGSGAKIRAWPDKLVLDPGRYRVTAYLRGLDIGTGPYKQTTEFMFAGKYLPLRKNGTFGWTRLTYVGDVPQKKEQSHPSFGLMASGYLWVDDVSVEKVAAGVPLTPQPVLGAEEKPVEPPGEFGRAPAALPRVRLPQQRRLGPLLCLRHAADGEKSHGRRAGRQAHHLLRGAQLLRRRHRRQ